MLTGKGGRGEGAISSLDFVHRYSATCASTKRVARTFTSYPLIYKSRGEHTSPGGGEEGGGLDIRSDFRHCWTVNISMSKKQIWNPSTSQPHFGWRACPHPPSFTFSITSIPLPPRCCHFKASRFVTKHSLVGPHDLPLRLPLPLKVESWSCDKRCRMHQVTLSSVLSSTAPDS